MQAVSQRPRIGTHAILLFSGFRDGAFLVHADERMMKNVLQEAAWLAYASADANLFVKRVLSTVSMVWAVADKGTSQSTKSASILNS